MTPGLTTAEEHGKNGGRMLEIAIKALPAEGDSPLEGRLDSDKRALVRDGDLIVLVVDAGAFVLAPAHADDDVVATQFANCKVKTLPIFPNLGVEGICGVWYMEAAFKHVDRKMGSLGMDTKRSGEAPGHKVDRAHLVKQHQRNIALELRNCRQQPANLANANDEVHCGTKEAEASGVDVRGTFSFADLLGTPLQDGPSRGTGGRGPRTCNSEAFQITFYMP